MIATLEITRTTAAACNTLAATGAAPCGPTGPRGGA